MSFNIFCTNCGQKLEADDEHIGQEIPCPACSTVIKVFKTKTSILAEANEIPKIPENTTEPTKALNNLPESNQAIGETVEKGRDHIEKVLNTIKTSKVVEELNPRAREIVSKGRDHANRIFKDLKSIDFKDEIIPIDGNNIEVLVKDFVFWSVSLLGILPLFIATITSQHTQITVFSWFFAFVWGVIFKLFILKNNDSWKYPLMSLFFTGIIGVPVLLFLYNYVFPNWYANLPENNNPVISLFGYIFQTGLIEELLKAIPILIIIFITKGKINALSLVAIGVFSGLGFAAFENIGYEMKAVISTIKISSNFGDEGTVYAVQGAMITAMLRSISCVFCHATWSGIFGYFIATAFIRKEKIVALSLVGLGVAATLHGLYDWLQGMQQTLAALVAGLSFALFLRISFETGVKSCTSGNG